MGVLRRLLAPARGLLALRRPIGLRLLGIVLAFGSGVLISAVAYELVEDAFGTAGGSGVVGLGLLAGALAFYLGDLAIDRFGGEARKRATGGQDAGSALAIVLGTVLDGIPESIRHRPVQCQSTRGQAGAVARCASLHRVAS